MNVSGQPLVSASQPLKLPIPRLSSISSTSSTSSTLVSSTSTQFATSNGK